MTTQHTVPQQRADASAPVTESWWLRPKVALPAVALILLLALLLAPHQESSMDVRLTTYSAGPAGARGIYDVLARLGWRVSRRSTKLSSLDTAAVYAILAPPTPLDSAERMELLRTVRSGGKLFLVSQDTQLTALFHMYVYPDASGRIVAITQTSAAGDSANIIHREERDSSALHAIFSESWIPQLTISSDTNVDHSVAVLLWASSNRNDSTTATPLMLGRRVGRGRVVLAGYPALLSNAIVQEGHSALAVQRAIEWLAPPNRTVIFDEYHQVVNRESAPGVLSVIVQALTDTAAGRAGIQVIAAALVLLIALGVRPIPPRPVHVIQRRSLLEHVDALGRAYQQIHASRFGVRQLIRGLRRRHPTGAAIARWTVTSDMDYLTAVQYRYGVTQQDMDAVTRALRSGAGTSEVDTSANTNIDTNVDAESDTTFDTASESATARDEMFLHAGRTIGSIEHSMHIP